MKTHHAITFGLCLFLSAVSAPADSIDDHAISQMPVKEITVFKDGHAFVLHEGAMPTDDNGNVVLDNLPTPVIGTFWAYADDEAAELGSVLAARRVVSVERTATVRHHSWPKCHTDGRDVRSPWGVERRRKA